MPFKGHVFKSVVCGDGNVGKTSLILQYTEHKFTEKYIQTIGTNFAIADVMLPEGNPVKLQLWDLGGQEQFNFAWPSFYAGAFAGILVYDITRRETLQSLPTWQAGIEKYAGRETLYFVFGNKCDLESERAVTTAEGESMTRELGASGFWETSAKTGENLREAFYAIAEKLFQIYE
ncbi:MAG TPA: Rab family GTPase [Candidatus Lokiarchaeia archaeon]|nr:Rab family GTPase [Candidatus Lokiarchaeia archaeon]